MEMNALVAVAIAVVIGMVTMTVYGTSPMVRRSRIETSEEHKAYSLLFHPECCWMDKVVSLVSYFVFPLRTLIDASLRELNDTTSTSKTLLRFREKLCKLEDMSHAMECKVRNKKLQSENDGDFLVGGTVIIPRDDNILMKWGLISEEDGARISLSKNSKCEVEILVTCPLSCIEGDLEFIENDGNKSREKEGFKRFQTCKLEIIKFKASSKKLIWFHGGGMVLGSSKDSCPKLVNDLLSFSRKYTTRNKTRKDDIVLMSVDYHLAPENPFPSAVIDGLSVVSHLFRFYDELHIAGISAGGNLATVVGLECYRKFGSRVKSVVIIDPMLDPTAQSLSFQRNSSKYLFSPAPWLRWAWAMYLAIDVDENVDFSDGLQHQSMIENSRWKEFFQKPIWRLACPLVDVPKILDDHGAPIIVVTSSKADPLRGDAQLIVEKLKDAKYNVTHIESRGIHVMSRQFDTKANDKFMQAWNEAIGDD
jgi:acetyl esterase/lipase